MEHTIHEVSYGTSRFAVRSRVNIFGVGECSIDEIIVDTNEYYLSGIAMVKIILKTETGDTFTWRSIPYSLCVLTFDAGSQLE